MINHKKLRKYLPKDRNFYRHVVYNYLNTEWSDEFYLGENLIINYDKEKVGCWRVFYKNEPIFEIKLTIWHTQENRYCYTLRPYYDKNINFTTHEFHSFSVEDRMYMMDNYFYEYICFILIISKIHEYVMERLDLPQVIRYEVDLDKVMEKYSAETSVNDARLIEIFHYLRDARKQNIPILEKNEIDHPDQLKVYEK